MKKISEFTFGFDLGDRQSIICVLDASGDVVEQSKVATNNKAFKKYFDNGGMHFTPPISR